MASKGERDAGAPEMKRRGRAFAVGAVSLALVAFAVGRLVVARRVPPNLLLVTIDTLRADHLGAYGYGAASTPVLDGLAGRGARFLNAHASVPLTGPSHATILTGLYPPVHGVRDNVVFDLARDHATLASRLKINGYRTAAFVAAYPVAAAFGFRQGFDEFGEDFHQASPGGLGAERPANEVADAALRWLAKPGRGPFFLWLHLYDPHAPYTPPPPYDSQFRGRPYDGEIAFADSQLGRVLGALRASGLLERTIVVALADHGESLGEHGERTHGVLIYQSTIRIPLMMAGPGIPARVVSERVGTVDLVPTLLAMLGLAPPEGLPGRDLSRLFRGEKLPNEPLYSESLFGRLNCRWASLRGFVRDDWKLIEGSEPELYQLAGDANESSNRAAAEPQRVARMRVELQGALRRMAPSGDSARAKAIPSEQEERLRSLGYTAGTGGAGRLDEPGLPDPKTHVHVYERLQALLSASIPRPGGGDEASALTAEDPGNPFAHFVVASLAYQTGDFASASHAFAKSLELDPDRPHIRVSYGRLLREMGRLAESERQLRIAEELAGSDDVRTRVNLAETLIASGKTDEAGRILDDVLSREPRQLDAQGARGRLLLALGRSREAIGYLEQSASSGEPDAWTELARAQLGLGDAKRAEQAAGEALKRSPGHPWALALAGHALIVEGRRETGKALLEQSLRARPRRASVWLDLATGFDAAGDHARASLCRREARGLSRG